MEEKRDFIWALQKLANNDKVRKKDWMATSFLYSKNGVLTDSNDKTCEIYYILSLYRSAANWELANESRVQLGDKLELVDTGEIWLVAVLEPKKIGLVSIKTGHRWSTPIECHGFDEGILLTQITDYQRFKIMKK
jgi:hypothetical protein